MTKARRTIPQEIDRIVHEPARLKVLGQLYVVESADFLFVMRQTGLTQGNLSSHMTKLEEAGYVAVEKEFAGKRPRTLLRMTQAGRTAFEGYVTGMKQLLDEVPIAAPKARPQRLALATMKVCFMLMLVGFTRGATTEVAFTSQDGYPMKGKLTLPDTPGQHAVVIYAQTAEGMTVDMKRPLGGGRTFNYFDLYREKLPAMNVGFFSYEGRGVRMGDSPPRYEAIDTEVYNTSTLDNKVRDALSAVQAVKKQEGVNATRIFLMGASEGTLLAAEAASHAPEDIYGAVLYAVVYDSLKDALHFMSGEGAYMQIASIFDRNKDGRILPEEYTNEPAQRRAGLTGVPFTQLDADSDGVFASGDFVKLRQPIIDAIDKGEFATIYSWLKVTAAVSTPQGWLEDHYAHPAMWTSVAKITGPVGFFHGEADPLTPVAGTRALEARAKAAGKTNFEFRYFDGLDHSLGLGAYFAGGALPAGHEAIFEFIRAHTR